MKVSRVEEMRQLDATAIERLGIPDQILMENAGLASYHVLQNHMRVRGRRFAAVCGSGNNGGDGFVVARKLHSNGADVRIFVVGTIAKMRGAAATNLEIARQVGISIVELDSAASLESELERCDGVVDAIFGTGLSRPVEGLHAEAIEATNRSGKPILSIDIPSGVNGESGGVMGVAVEASVTVTYGLPKLGNLLYPGYALGGRLYVTHISFPPSLYEDDELKAEINVPAPLEPRSPHGHKGSFGDALFVAGAGSYYGAPLFSARAFLKAGGGYARLACPASLASVVAASGPEIVFHPQEETPRGTLARGARDTLLELASGVDFLVVGPGLSRDTETAELVRELAAHSETPLLLDGDGLSAVSDATETLADRRAPTVLTPHPGEMSRLTGEPVSHILERGPDIVQKYASGWGAYVVLKGAHSLIGYPDGRLFINPSGNSGMATAGSGDVLNGTIAAAFGLGLELPEAVRAGVFLHGFAGDIAAAEHGADGVTALSIVDALPRALERYRSEHSLLFDDFYGMLRVV
jgi:NAD(P)H-hydrate epimerase